MPEVRIAAAVLAAGQSRRFGAEDKLSAPFADGLLGQHVPAVLGGLDLDHRWIIASRSDHPCAASWSQAGFEIAVNERAADGMGHSLALAAQLAAQAGVDGLLIALADMPFVPASHFTALLERGAGRGPEAIVASQGNEQRSPPAWFGRAHLAALAAAAGDHGARHLLTAAEPIACSPDWLHDIDVPADLARLPRT